MEKDWSSAHHFRNFPRQKEITLHVIGNADTAFYFVGQDNNRVSLLKDNHLWRMLFYYTGTRQSFTHSPIEKNSKLFITFYFGQCFLLVSLNSYSEVNVLLDPKWQRLRLSIEFRKISIRRKVFIFIFCNCWCTNALKFVCIFIIGPSWSYKQHCT